MNVEKYLKELDDLYEYIEKYFIYYHNKKDLRLNFKEFLTSRDRLLTPYYCEFIQLQSWNNKKYFKHYGGIGNHNLPNVIAYKTYSSMYGVNYNFSEWKIKTENCNKIN